LGLKHLQQRDVARRQHEAAARARVVQAKLSRNALAGAAHDDDAAGKVGQGCGFAVAEDECVSCREREDAGDDDGGGIEGEGEGEVEGEGP